MGQQGLEEKESKKADIQSGQGVDVCTLGVTAGVMKTWPTRPGPESDVTESSLQFSRCFCEPERLCCGFCRVQSQHAMVAC